VGLLSFLCEEFHLGGPRVNISPFPPMAFLRGVSPRPPHPARQVTAHINKGNPLLSPSTPSSATYSFPPSVFSASRGRFFFRLSPRRGPLILQLCSPFPGIVFSHPVGLLCFHSMGRAPPRFFLIRGRRFLYLSFSFSVVFSYAFPWKRSLG